MYQWRKDKNFGYYTPRASRYIEPFEQHWVKGYPCSSVYPGLSAKPSPLPPSCRGRELLLVTTLQVSKIARQKIATKLSVILISGENCRSWILRRTYIGWSRLASNVLITNKFFTNYRTNCVSWDVRFVYVC